MRSLPFAAALLAAIDDSSFTSGNLPPGQTFQTTFSSQGTFTYPCAIHPRMTGAVTVTP